MRNLFQFSILYTSFIPKVRLFEIKSYFKLTHREILGSLFGLNISNEIFGDIIIDNGKYYFYVMDEIADFVLNNLYMIGNKSVKVSEVEEGKKDSASVAKTAKSKPVKKTVKPKAETVAKVTKSKAVAKKATAKKQDVKPKAAKKAIKVPAGKAKPATKTPKAPGKTLAALTKAIVSKPKRTVNK